MEEGSDARSFWMVLSDVTCLAHMLLSQEVSHLAVFDFSRRLLTRQQRCPLCLEQRPRRTQRFLFLSVTPHLSSGLRVVCKMHRVEWQMLTCRRLITS